MIKYKILAGFRQLIILNCILLLTACGSDNQELNQYIVSIKARPARPIEPLPTFLPVPQFKYPENANRRDPFMQPPSQKKADTYAPNQNRKKQTLEAFPLDALKFVGTLKEGTLIWALIQQPNGKITRIKTGNFMGQDFGKVIRITEDSIKLEEIIKDEGNWAKHLITLHLNTTNNNASN